MPAKDWQHTETQALQLGKDAEYACQQSAELINIRVAHASESKGDRILTSNLILQIPGVLLILALHLQQYWPIHWATKAACLPALLNPFISVPHAIATLQYPCQSVQPLVLDVFKNIQLTCKWIRLKPMKMFDNTALAVQPCSALMTMSHNNCASDIAELSDLTG